MSKQICPECNGEGVLWSYESGDKYAEREPYDCDECDGSGFVTDSGTGEEPVYNMDEVDLCAKCGTMKHLNQYGVCGRCYPTLPVMDSAPQPSEAEGKPVPAPATPLPADDKPHAPLLEKHDSQLEPFEEWYAKTKAHGGTREEYDKLKTAVAPNPIPDELMAILHRLEDYRRKDESKWENSLTAPEAHAAITRLYAGREVAARVDELEQVIIAHYAIEGAKRDRTFAEHLSARLASLREGGANGK